MDTETHDQTPETDVKAAPLSDEAISALKDLVASALKEEQVTRRAEVRKAWQQRAYLEGNQHLWWDKSSHCFLSPQAANVELPRYMDAYNIYKPHQRSFVSILSQNPPGVNFVPADLQAPLDVTAAAYAEKMRHRVDRLVHLRDRQTEAASYFCTDGRVVAWVRLDDNGQQLVTMHGVLESKVPLFVRKMENWGYAVLSEEVDALEAKFDNPDFAEQIESQDNLASDGNYERYARLNVIGDSRGALGDAFRNLATRHVAWLRPSRYRKAKTVQDELLSFGPEGVRVTIIGGAVVEVIPERMESALRVQWPCPGQGASRPSLLHDIIALQDAYNDYKNNLRDQASYINPATWVDGDAIDEEAIPEQRSEAGAVHRIKPRAGKNISDCVFQETSNGISPDMVAACDKLLSDAEFITGDLPAVFGSGTPDQETATGQKMLADQAKGQLSTAWAAIQWLFAGIYDLAVRQQAQMSGGNPVAIQGGNGHDSFNPQAILDGQFGCYPDTDSSFPETMADKRASLQMVLGQLGQADPKIVLQQDNLKLVKQYSGLADLVIPGAEARDKQLREIQQLLQETPVPDMAQMQQFQQSAMQAQQTGQPMPQPPMTSSVPVDADWDFHQAECDKVQEWLSSDARYEEERKGNQLGIENVRLHGALHRAELAKQAAGSQQQQVMTISGAFKDLDPATKVQVLQRDGYQPDATAFEAQAAQSAQSVAADTQKTAADAQHKSVLAAKEAVTPPKPVMFGTPSPDQLGQGM